MELVVAVGETQQECHCQRTKWVGDVSDSKDFF